MWEDPMRKVLLFGMILAVSALAAFAQETADIEKEQEAIEQAALDYVDGFYEGSAERMAKGVHPSLQKIRVVKLKNGREIFDFADQDMLVNYCMKSTMKIPVEQRKIEVDIFDVYKNTASVKIDSMMFVDYAHIAKINGEWRVINVLWAPKQYSYPDPTDDDKAAIEQAALDYVDGALSGDGARVAKGVHPTLHKVVVRKLPTGMEFFDRADLHKLVEVTNSGQVTTPAEERNIEVESFDAYKKTATVKIDSADFVDFAHIVKINGEWKVINVLWANRE
jgi:hypothetical protein